MPKVQSFQVEGLMLWFWSKDHEPPHFHAKKKGDWEVKVYFLNPPQSMIERVWVFRYPREKALRQLCLSAEMNRSALLTQWEEIQGQ